jgi:hypothetical protein
MNILYKIIYKNDIHLVQEKSLELNKLVNCDNIFECTIENDTNGNIYSFQMNLLDNTKVDAILNVQISFNEDEVIKTVQSLLPNLNFKYFIPDQLEITTSSRKLIYSLKKAYSFNFKHTSRTIDINIIIDAPFLHPAWDYSKGQRFSTANPIVNKNRYYKIDFDLIEIKKEKRIVAIKKFPYPNGYKSAFILTDHCDFDTTEKLKIFLYGNNNNGWLNRGLKITKGVFALGPIEGEIKKSDSLESEIYSSLIDELYNDGSEIVHHALKHSGQLTKEVFNTTFNQFAQKYKPQTWIDHGSYIKYCYSQGSKENPDFLLIEKMKQLGYNNLWSFDDVNIDANQTLNILTTSKKFPTELIKQIGKNVFARKFLIAGHYFRTIIHRNYSKSIFSDFLMYSLGNTKSIFINLQKRKGTFLKDCKAYLKKILHFNKFRNKEVIPYNNIDVLKYAQPLYLEDRIPFAQYSEQDILMFYTFETTHLVDIYNKKSLQKLIDENGTHIGHTYILNDLPYINSIFEKNNQELKLAKNWIDFLNILQEKVESKDVWNANMGEYVAYNIALQNVFISYSTNGDCTIKNENKFDITDFTFVSNKGHNIVINNQKIEAAYEDKNYDYYIQKIEAQSKIVVHSS